MVQRDALGLRLVAISRGGNWTPDPRYPLSERASAIAVGSLERVKVDAPRPDTPLSYTPAPVI